MPTRADSISISDSPEGQLLEIVQGSAKFNNITLEPLRQDTPDSTIYIEEVQHRLNDLGYTTIDAENLSKEYDEQTCAAVKRFQKEAGLKISSALDDYTWDKLALFYEYDNTPPLTKKLFPGQRSVWIRALQWKMRQLGMYQYRVTGHYDENTSIAVQSLNAVLGLPLDRLSVDKSFWQAVCNPYELTRLLINRLNGRSVIVPMVRWGESVSDLNGCEMNNGWFEEDDFIDYEDEFDSFSVEDLINTFVDRFACPIAIPLLQLRLSIAGYDTGRLDGYFGPKAFAALQAFLNDEGVSLDAVLRRIDESQGVLSFNVFSTLGIDPPSEEELARYEQAVVDAANAETQSQQNLSEEKGFFTRLWEKVKGKSRQLWIGFKDGIIRAGKAIARGVGNAIHWVWDRLQVVTGAAFNALKTLYYNIRKMLRSVGHALQKVIQWATGRLVVDHREASTHIGSRYYIDSDMVNVCSISTDPNVVQLHAKKMIRNSKILIFACRLTGIAIGMVSKLPAGPIAWPYITIRLVKELKDAVFQYCADMVAYA